MQIRDVVVAPSTSGDGKAQAYLAFQAFSQSEDTLTGVTIAGAAVTPTDPAATLTVKPQAPLVISDPETPTTNPGLAINGLPQPPVVGTTLTVTLSFQNAGSVTVQAPVRDLTS